MQNSFHSLAYWSLLLLVSGGCRGIGDPACAVRDERADSHARDLLYHPEASLTGLDEAPWQRCPVHWRPACAPLFRCRPPARSVAAASEVLALPQHSGDPDGSTGRSD